MSVTVTFENNTKIELNKPTISIGSSPNNDIVFEKNASISPNHATIILQEKEFILYSHTFLLTTVNNKNVDKHQLENNSSIQLGIKGPKFTFAYDLDDLQNIKSKYDESFDKRWYDNCPLLSKAFNILYASDVNNVIKIAEFLTDVFNKYNDKFIYIGANSSILKEIENLPRQHRWYDSNKEIQELIESIRLYDSQAQEKIAIDIIKMLDCFESR